MEPTVPSPIDVQTWPQALVYVVLIVAVLIVPSTLTYLTNRNTKQVQRQFENNGGSTMKDAVDRIEGLLVDHITEADARDADRDARIAALEAKPEEVQTDG